MGGDWGARCAVNSAQRGADRKDSKSPSPSASDAGGPPAQQRRTSTSTSTPAPISTSSASKGSRREASIWPPEWSNFDPQKTTAAAPQSSTCSPWRRWKCLGYGLGQCLGPRHRRRGDRVATSSSTARQWPIPVVASASRGGVVAPCACAGPTSCGG